MSANKINTNRRNPDLPVALIPRTLLALVGSAVAPPGIYLTIGLITALYSSLSKQGGGQIQQYLISLLAVVLLIFIVSCTHVFLLGIPAFIIAWYFNAIRWWTSMITAFVIGAIPTAILLWPSRYPKLYSTVSMWDGEKMVQTMIDGIPTMAGWFGYISTVTIMGLFGVCGGFVFWLIWRRRPLIE